MKRGTPRHRKMHALAAALKLPLHSVVGVMEMLWHYAGQNTPEGDIGSVPNREIAAAVDWAPPKRPDVLVDALVKTGWLDRDEKYRLVIHDWPQHCEQAVRKWLDRNGKCFLPVYGNCPVSVRTESGYFPDGVSHSREAKAVAKASESESSSEEKTQEAFLNLPFDTLETPAIALVKPPVEQWFADEFWPLYWRKVDRANALKAFKKYAVDEETKDRIVAAVKAQAPQYMARDSEHRPHAATWLNARRFEEDPEVFEPAKSTIVRLLEDTL